MPVGRLVLRERFPIAGTFRIARGAKTEAEVVTVELTDPSGAIGWAEAVPYTRYGETVEAAIARIEQAPLDRAALAAALPPGAARNALDCALWDLEAQLTGRPVWELAGLPPPRPVPTAFTLSLDAPAAMAARAAGVKEHGLLKLKLDGGADDLARVEAVHAAAPGARLIVDANESFTADHYAALAPRLAALGVVAIEQPFPAGADGALASLPRPVPIIADESCHGRATVPALAGRYDLVSLKLDKTGGLTEALATRDAARRAGLGVMVGCMVSSSLAIAPAFLLADGAELVDLDGPLLLATDRPGGARLEGGLLHPPTLWGSPRPH